MNDLWAVTALFNPMGYRSRAENYRVFRERLAAPLVAVELACDGSFLRTGDAERVVRVRGGDVLWQKERLLNLALRHLPPECRHVVWLDADLVFDDDDWIERTRAALAQRALVQAFSTARHLRRGADPGRRRPGDTLLARESMGAKQSRGEIDFAALAAGAPPDFSTGLAWAMRRELIERVGFYDAAVCGGASLLMGAAAAGEIEAIVRRFRMGAREAEHARRWARSFREAAGGGMGFVEGGVAHLWHGERSNRGYGTRFALLESAGFDPESDLVLGPEGAWLWASEKPHLHAGLRSYFSNRREDGD
ncbi:MAG: hypothetical protein ACYC9Y_05425 [Candidatus Methylomirabilia bacterium]